MAAKATTKAAKAGMSDEITRRRRGSTGRGEEIRERMDKMMSLMLLIFLQVEIPCMMIYHRIHFHLLLASSRVSNATLVSN